MNVFEEFNCIKDSEFGSYSHPDLPFDVMYKDSHGNLVLKVNSEYRVDGEVIPLTEANFQNLLIAFNPDKYVHQG